MAGYLDGERRLGRIGRNVKPSSVAALLFGSCFYWAFIRQAMGRNLFAMKDQEFVTGLVETLMRGLLPTPLARAAGKPPRRTIRV